MTCPPGIRLVSPVLVGLVLLVRTAACVGVERAEQHCEQGWLRTMDRCYFWGQGIKVTWAEARQECHSRGSDLLTINNDIEQNWVSIQTEEYSTEGWWLGLRYNAVDNAFQWISSGAKPIDTINWNVEPDNYDGQNCASISEYALFSDDSCANKYGYICKAYKTEEQRCPDSSQGSNWAFLDSACYWISDPALPSQRLTWSEARAACRHLTVHGLPMHLLSINLGLELKDTAALVFGRQSFFQTELADRSKDGVNLPWWTSLNDQVAEGVYEWADNSLWNASLTPWDSAPNNDPAQSCGLMSAGGLIDDVKCKQRAEYICKKSAVKKGLDVGCPEKWVRGAHSCYHFATIRGFPWLQARHYCQIGGGDLLKVDSLSEKFWLETMQVGSVGFWTGLNDREKEGDWRWADGKTYNPAMVKWYQEPNDFQGSEDCAQLSRDGVLNDIACTAKAGYICEYVLDPGAECIPGWLQYANKGCYYISPTNTSDLLMWYEVQRHCLDLVQAHDRDLQAFFLALETQGEKTWLLQQLQRLPLTAVQWWTGLNDIPVEGNWTWATTFSNPPVPYLIQWAGEPNNLNGDEDCAVMYQGGRYNDLNCDTPASFICEKPAGHGDRLGLSIWLPVLCLLSSSLGNVHQQVSPS